MTTHKTIQIRIEDYDKLEILRNSSVGKVSFTELIHSMIEKWENKRE